MMKTILLLAFTVLVSSGPAQPSHTTLSKPTYKHLLRELIDELDKAVKNISKDATEKSNVFLTELKDCKPETFCHAEAELRYEVSGLSAAIFDQFHTDKKLMRNLNAYNMHHGKTCKAAAKGPVHVHLHAFLKRLLACVKSEFNQLK